MAWNKPSTENQQLTKKSAAETPSLKRGVLAGAAVVVALGALCLYLFSGGEATRTSLQKKDRGLIKEVTPAAAPTNVVAQTEKNERESEWKFEDGRKLPKDAYKDEKGVWRHPGGQRVFDETAPVHKPKHAQKQLFKHYSENMIGGLLSARPGSTMAGTVRYNSPGFMEDFMKSCAEPVELLDTDTPKERALKLEVEKTKQELLERFRKGEDIAKILAETRKELQKLGEVTRLMKDEIRKVMADETLSDEEVGDYINAANKLLESKGASPLRTNPVSVGNIRYHFKKESIRGADSATETKAQE